MHDYRVRVGLRDSDSTKYVGEPKKWDKAEQACRDAAATLDVTYTEEPGEAAFYGPKIDFVVRDVLEREWQLGTVQVDYNLPERFDLSYIGPDNQSHRPVMIHRAPFGSMERFVGVLIEHFAGNFPLWLSPLQVMVLPITHDQTDHAETTIAALIDRGIRAEVDDSSEKIGKKIRNAEIRKVPVMFVIGAREAENRSVAVRLHGRGDQGVKPLDEAITDLAQMIDDRVV